MYFCGMSRLFYLILFLPSFIFGQAPGCPDIQVDDETVACDDPCVDLVATNLHTGETTQYDVSPIPYAPPYAFTGGTSAFIGTDDIFSPIIQIPFDFCFYGNTYNQLVIGANGLISFDISLANAFCAYSYTASIPSTPTIAGPYENSIHGAYHDIDPSIAGDINYEVIGNAPCRTFVVNFSNTAHFSCSNLLTTQQIVIYETTNAIEIYINDKPTCATWNSGNAIIGIQNIGATQGICPNSRNTGPWTANQEAWRFTPSGTPNYTIEWFNSNGATQGFGDTLFNICSQIQENYTAEITYTNCNGTIVTETATNTVYVNSTAGQLSNLVLSDTIKSCISQVTINADNTLDTYQWSTGETTASITVSNSGNYILEATQSGCDGNDTVYVSIVSANILESNTTICNLETVELNIEESNIIVNWSTSETSDNIVVIPSSNTQFWVEVSDEITTCRDSVQINVNSLPTVIITGVDEICKNDSTSLNLNFTGSQPFNLELNGITKSYNNLTNSLEINPISTTTYTVNQLSDIFCTNDTSKAHTIVVNPIPEPIIDPTFYELYPGEEISLSGGVYSFYWWYSNDSLISENEILIIDSTLTTYLVVESEKGCTGNSATAEVKYIPRVELYIPNTFTPNNDEHNDLLVTTGYNIESFYMIITNRWGEVVFITNDINKFWDGNYKGKHAEQEVYSYQVNIIGADKRPFITTGTVNAIY
jgi:gliding motility-associated-like protein